MKQNSNKDKFLKVNTKSWKHLIQRVLKSTFIMFFLFSCYKIHHIVKRCRINLLMGSNGRGHYQWIRHQCSELCVSLLFRSMDENICRWWSCAFSQVTLWAILLCCFCAAAADWVIFQKRLIQQHVGLKRQH